jgi:hypothetical protein
MNEDQKLYLESLGYRIVNGYIKKNINSETEPKKYWSDRPQTLEYQIWGWQIVAHESKAELFINNLKQELRDIKLNQLV